MSRNCVAFLLLLFFMAVSALAHAEPQHLPLPLAKGGYAGYLVPAPLSGPLGFHVRGTLLAAPGEPALALGGQVGLSMSFLYGEAGATFYGAAMLARDAAPVQRRGPIEVWMRLGPFYPAWCCPPSASTRWRGRRWMPAAP
jgi:hypothetical protein